MHCTTNQPCIKTFHHAVARHGTDDQRQALINDEDWRVRKAVAQYGTDAQRQAFIGDEDSQVIKDESEDAVVDAAHRKVEVGIGGWACRQLSSSCYSSG